MAKGEYKPVFTSEQKENISLVSLLFFRWMNGVFQSGSHGTIEETDFVPLSRENTTGSLTDLLESKWNEEKANCKENGKRPKLWRSILKMVSFKDTFIIVIDHSMYTVWRLVKPLFLGYLIFSLMSAEPQKNLSLYGCVLAMCICATIGGLSVHYSSYKCDTLGIGMSSALKGLIYRKVNLFLMNFF